MKWDKKRWRTLWALVAIEYEHPIFAKSRTPAILMAIDVLGEITTLSSISKATDAKSAAKSQKQPAANKDAFTCRIRRITLIICHKWIILSYQKNLNSITQGITKVQRQCHFMHSKFLMLIWSNPQLKWIRISLIDASHIKIHQSWDLFEIVIGVVMKNSTYTSQFETIIICILDLTY